MGFELKPYLKVVTRNCYGVCAIYEPHPFRASAIREAIESAGYKTNADTGIEDNAWCWVYYDWCGNPIGLSGEMPEGTIVDKFTKDNLGDENLAEYLNKENEEFVDLWYRCKGEKQW